MKRPVFLFQRGGNCLLLEEDMKSLERKIRPFFRASCTQFCFVRDLHCNPPVGLVGTILVRHVGQQGMWHCPEHESKAPGQIEMPGFHNGACFSSVNQALRCLCVCAQSCLTLCNPIDCSTCPWDFPDKNTGVCCHFRLQGKFLTQGSNPRSEGAHV